MSCSASVILSFTIAADMERFRITSDADLEAVTVSETYRLLSEVFGPYCFKVSGEPGHQQAVFQSGASFSLFMLFIHELMVESTDVFAGSSASKNLSLLDAGRWLIARYPSEANAAGWDRAAAELVRWMDAPVGIRCWSAEIWQHLEYSTTYRAVLVTHANFTKHSLLKLGVELKRIRRLCADAGIRLTDVQLVSAKEELARHLEGMMQYHATQIAELCGRYFLGLYRFIKARYERTPTNNLDKIEVPVGMTDPLFRYLYASAVFSLSRWTEHRIVSSIPETGPHFKPLYPQHEGPDWNGHAISSRR